MARGTLPLQEGIANVKTVITNALVFQAGWLCCVLAGANHLPWLGTFAALLIVGQHVIRAVHPRSELLLVACAGIIGAVWDSILVYAGWLAYPSGILVEGTAPHWIVAMWLLFATTLNVSLRFLKQRPLLASLAGAIGGPAAYFAGYRLGGVQITDFTAAMTALALGWSLFMPLLMWLAGRFDGINPASAVSRLAESNIRV
jgi:hypothetical protein